MPTCSNIHADRFGFVGEAEPVLFRGVDTLLVRRELGAHDREPLMVVADRREFAKYRIAFHCCFRKLAFGEAELMAQCARTLF